MNFGLIFKACEQFFLIVILFIINNIMNHYSFSLGLGRSPASSSVYPVYPGPILVGRDPHPDLQPLLDDRNPLRGDLNSVLSPSDNSQRQQVTYL